MRRARLDESLIYQSIVRRKRVRLINDTYKISTFSIFFVAFLLLVGIISGIATLNLLGETTKSYYIASVGKAILVSSAFNILMLAVSIMCAIWIFGILPLIAAILLKGFILSFSACALIMAKYGFLGFAISIVIPNMVLLYAHFTLILISLSEWSNRFKNFFQNRAQTKSINTQYFQAIRPCLIALVLGIIIEGIIAPLLMRAIQ
ncbi:MAG TPA: hypothetical protein GXZ61_02385 [Clostridiales bacterium]|jgi:hypothetical protein|nr:hypothetical protein [Clostridiales bacterium]